ncbi:unnamed protein product, partial [Lactuca virosa]
SGGLKIILKKKEGIYRGAVVQISERIIGDEFKERETNDENGVLALNFAISAPFFQFPQPQSHILPRSALIVIAEIC